MKIHLIDGRFRELLVLPFELSLERLFGRTDSEQFTVLTLRSHAGEDTSATVMASTWHGDACEVFEWEQAGALLVAFADRIVAFSVPDLVARSTMFLEMTEGEIIEHPRWCPAERHLVVSTELHVWCIDVENRLRWAWPVRWVGPSHLIDRTPEQVGDKVVLHASTFKEERVVRIDLLTGEVSTEDAGTGAAVLRTD